jgi:uncharacterized RDD family membrane protein YckC
MTTTGIPENPRPHVGLVRRLMAIVYDLLLLLGLLFIVTAVANFTLNHGNAIDRHNPYYWFFESCLVLISFFYYGWFWTHGGQTLGMKTWKIKLSAKHGGSIRWTQALVYFLAAVLSWLVFGIGFLWSLFEPDRATWHDLIADCEMLDLRQPCGKSSI